MTFDDVLIIKNGKNQRAVENPDGKYPIYGSGGIMGYADDYICEADTVIVGRKGSINNPIFVEEPFWNVDTAFGLVAKREVLLPRYLYYFCRNYDFERLNKAVTIPSLTKSDLLKIEITLPSLEIQEKIVNKLLKIEEVIQARQQQLQKMDELVKARFIELFGDQTANPYAWQQTSIGACCTLKSGTSLPADKENEGGAIPYVKVGDMNYPGNEQYITTSSRFVSEQTAGTGVFPVGTVVFPKRGGAIGTNKKRLTRLPICADLNVMGVTAGRRLTPQYLMAYFNTVDLGTLNNGSSVPQINNKDIAPLLICIPPMALQEQFAAFVEQTDKSKVAVQKALDEAQLLFDSLMQKYFQ
jgi:type I restriction enzyme S subunit